LQEVDLSLSRNEKTKIHILIEITYRGKSEADKSPSKHLQILNALGEAFTKAELNIFDIKGKKVKGRTFQSTRIQQQTLCRLQSTYDKDLWRT
jgi:hypothetical protein